MQIIVYFYRDSEPAPLAVTGVMDGATDMLIPVVGDVVAHRDEEGRPFSGVVVQRAFDYDIPKGTNVQGRVSVKLTLEKEGLVH